MDYVTRQFINLAKKFRKELPSLKRSIEKVGSQIESATAEYKSNSQRTQPQPILRAELQRSESEINQEEPRKARAEKRDCVRLIVESVALGIGIIVAVANIGLWIVTKESVGIASTAASAAQKSAASSEQQVRATEESIHTTVSTFQLDQRAWIFVDAIPPIVKAGEPFNPIVNFKNSGKTPAKNLVIRHRGEFVPKGKVPSALEENLPGIGAVPPNAIYHTTLGDYVKKQTDLDVSRINNGDIVLWIHGRATYDDVFGTSHWITYCLKFVPIEKTQEHGQGGFELCGQGNDLGDGSPPAKHQTYHGNQN